MRVVGVDGCPDGWFAVVLDERAFAFAFFAESIAEVLRRSAGCAVVAVDIPIGSEPDRFRRVDDAARAFVKPRHHSVFNTPPRNVFEQPTYDDARSLCLRMVGKSLSKQCYALREKVLEVAGVVAQGDNIIEVHPEVSFRALQGKPLQSSKGTWAGHSLRRDLLAGVGIHLPGDLGEAGLRAGVDDVVDAAAAAWSAHRHGLRESERLEPVTTDANGREVTIWY